MKTIDEFLASLKQPRPAADLPPLLQAMWHEARGDWQRAHEIAQKHGGADACWVHAYLHRKEGDLSNAGYWYARARRAVPKDTLEQEWRLIVGELIPVTDAQPGSGAADGTAS